LAKFHIQEDKGLKIMLNGKEHMTVSSSMTIFDLLEELNMPKIGLVAELDGEIIPNDKLSSKDIKDGSKIELIRIVGGG
jgi:thiamine biosynthesis protein ThiS